MPRPARPSFGYFALILKPDAAALAALSKTEAAYLGLARWLDEKIGPDANADLVSLHRAWYAQAREAWALPSQMIALAFKDWAARRRGDEQAGIPYDSKLYVLRGLASVSLTTVDGRLPIPCVHTGFRSDAIGPTTARLVRTGEGWEFRVGVLDHQLVPETGGSAMSTESVLSRISRVVAGMAHAAVAAAEQANPEATLEQAIREIDSAAEEVRGELGKITAERHRLVARLQELDRERADLDVKIDTAVANGRDDLAEAGIARQLDIESQSGLLSKVRADVDEQVIQLERSLEAVRASRREAESRLGEMRRARAASGGVAGNAVGTADPVSRARAKVDRAQQLAERVTGVPAAPASDDAAALEELHRLHREDAVRERLARLKAKRG